ncbi:MAG: hypothetical protein QXL91_06955 [Candidatus Bathyarchaeia archaeon]
MVFYGVDVVFFSRFVDFAVWLCLLVVMLFSLVFLFRRGFGGYAALAVLLLLLSSILLLAFNLLFWAWFAGFLGGVLLFFCGVSVRFRSVFGLDGGLVVLVWLLLMCAVGLLSCVRWVLNGFDGDVPLSDGSWYFPMLDLQLSLGVFYPVLPRIFLLFLAAWVLRVISFGYEDAVRGWFGRVFDGDGGEAAVVGRVGSGVGGLGPFMLFSALAAAVFVGVYPYLPALNPSSHLVGVDVAQSNGYYDLAVALLQSDSTEALNRVVRSDRTLYLAFQHLVVLCSGSADVGVRLMPAILSVLFASSSYLFASLGSGSRFLGGVCAIFSAFSFQVVAGVNAGFYANWFALTWVNLFFALFIRSLGCRLLRYFIPSLLASVFVLFTHPATWLVLMAALVVYGGLGLLRRLLRLCGGLSGFECALLLVVFAVNVAADLLRGYVLRGYEASSLSGVALSGFSLSYLLSVVGNLANTFTIFLGGALANPVIVFLSIVGLCAVARCANGFERGVVAFTLVPSLFVFFISSTFELGFLQARYIYLIPFQMLAGLGSVALLKILRGLSQGSRFGGVYPILFYVAVFASLFGYTLRVVGVLYPAVA